MICLIWSTVFSRCWLHIQYFLFRKSWWRSYCVSISVFVCSGLSSLYFNAGFPFRLPFITGTLPRGRASLGTLPRVSASFGLSLSRYLFSTLIFPAAIKRTVRNAIHIRPPPLTTIEWILRDIVNTFITTGLGCFIWRFKQRLCITACADFTL